MRERELEKMFTTEVKKVGGVALKFVSPGFDGMPDRLVLMPGGRTFFVELKRPGEKPRPLQRARHRMLYSFGFAVFVVDSIEKLDEVLNAIQTA